MPYSREQETQKLAYHLWIKRGAPFNDCPEADWFEAENLLQAEMYHFDLLTSFSTDFRASRSL